MAEFQRAIHTAQTDRRDSGETSGGPELTFINPEVPIHQVSSNLKKGSTIIRVLPPIDPDKDPSDPSFEGMALNPDFQLKYDNNGKLDYKQRTADGYGSMICPLNVVSLWIGNRPQVVCTDMLDEAGVPNEYSLLRAVMTRWTYKLDEQYLKRKLTFPRDLPDVFLGLRQSQDERFGSGRKGGNSSTYIDRPSRQYLMQCLVGSENGQVFVDTKGQQVPRCGVVLLKQGACTKMDMMALTRIDPSQPLSLTNNQLGDFCSMNGGGALMLTRSDVGGKTEYLLIKHPQINIWPLDPRWVKQAFVPWLKLVKFMTADEQLKWMMDTFGQLAPIIIDYGLRHQPELAQFIPQEFFGAAHAANIADADNIGDLRKIEKSQQPQQGGYSQQQGGYQAPQQAAPMQRSYGMPQVQPGMQQPQQFIQPYAQPQQQAFNTPPAMAPQNPALPAQMQAPQAAYQPQMPQQQVVAPNQWQPPQGVPQTSGPMPGHVVVPQQMPQQQVIPTDVRVPSFPAGTAPYISPQQVMAPKPPMQPFPAQPGDNVQEVSQEDVNQIPFDYKAQVPVTNAQVAALQAQEAAQTAPQAPAPTVPGPVTHRGVTGAGPVTAPQVAPDLKNKIQGILGRNAK